MEVIYNWFAGIYTAEVVYHFAEQLIPNSNQYRHSVQRVAFSIESKLILNQRFNETLAIYTYKRPMKSYEIILHLAPFARTHC